MTYDREHFEALRFDPKQPPVITEQDFTEMEAEELRREDRHEKVKETSELILPAL